MQNTTINQTTAEEPSVCECGDPRCVYVQNLKTAIEWLEQIAARPDSKKTTSPED